MKLNAKWSQNRIVLNLGYLNLRFVSDLGFRASDFNKKQGFTVPNRAVVLGLGSIGVWLTQAGPDQVHRYEIQRPKHKITKRTHFVE